MMDPISTLKAECLHEISGMLNVLTDPTLLVMQQFCPHPPLTRKKRMGRKFQQSYYQIQHLYLTPLHKERKRQSSNLNGVGCSPQVYLAIGVSTRAVTLFDGGCHMFFLMRR